MWPKERNDPRTELKGFPGFRDPGTEVSNEDDWEEVASGMGRDQMRQVSLKPSESVSRRRKRLCQMSSISKVRNENGSSIHQ